MIRLMRSGIDGYPQTLHGRIESKTSVCLSIGVAPRKKADLSPPFLEEVAMRHDDDDDDE
jgi:hypothetical protein